MCEGQSIGIYLFAKGTDNALWSTLDHSGVWHSLGGKMRADPGAAYSASAKMMAVSVRGTDGALYWKGSSNGKAWPLLWSKFPTGKLLTGTGPAVFIWGSKIGWVVTGTDHHLYFGWYNKASKTYSGWQSLGDKVAPGTGPAACSGFAAGREDVFVTDTKGSVIQNTRLSSSSGWSGWTSLGGHTSLSPAASAEQDIHVFVRGGGTQDLWTNVYFQAFNQNYYVWWGWEDWGAGP